MKILFKALNYAEERKFKSIFNQGLSRFGLILIQLGYPKNAQNIIQAITTDVLTYCDLQDQGYCLYLASLAIISGDEEWRTNSEVIRYLNDASECTFLFYQAIKRLILQWKSLNVYSLWLMCTTKLEMKKWHLKLQSDVV